MKIIVMSDSHGESSAVEKVVKLHEDADLFVHLGDGEKEVHLLTQTIPWFAEKLFFLKGNCDSGRLLKPTHTQIIMPLPWRHRFFAAHGDMLQVKYGTARIMHEARKAEADMVFYGHTHTRDCRYEDGLYIINPGSLGCPRDGTPPSYAVISVSSKGILANLVDV